MGHAKDIWGHSSPIGTEHYSIFAVGDDPIKIAAFKGWLKSHAIGYKALLGMYQDKTEQSFIINAKHIVQVAYDGWLAGQESILALGVMDSRDRRAAKLIFLNDDGFPTEDGDGPAWANNRAEKDLGVLQSVSRDEALNNYQQGWTYDPISREYFITVDPNAVKIDPHGLEEAWKITYGMHKQTLTNAIEAYLKNARS